MKLHSRPPIERMAYIARLLREGRGFQIKTVAASFGVCGKTVDRDIQFMRDRLGYDLEFHQTGPMEDWTWAGSAPKERVL